MEGGSPGAPEMGFGYELGVSELIAEIAQQLELSSGEDKGFLASLMDDFYWGAPFRKMVKVIDFVQKRGPDFGYHLNMGKSIYLMSPPAGQSLSEEQLEDRICQLEEVGIPRSNIKIHPACVSSCSSSLAAEREAPACLEPNWYGIFSSTIRFFILLEANKEKANLD